MKYSFVQIEKEKNKSIQYSIAFFVIFYFISMLLLVIMVKSFFIFHPSHPPETPIAFFGGILTVPLVLGTLVLALILFFWHWRGSVHQLVPKTLKLMQARPIDENQEQEKQFKNITEEISVAMGATSVVTPYIIPITAFNAFALQDFNGNTAIGITQGLLHHLNRTQLEGVVGREMAHIVSGDCLSTSVIMAIFKAFDNISDAMKALIISHFASTAHQRRVAHSKKSNDSSLVALFIAIYGLTFVLKALGFFGALFISREKEYRADAVAIRLTRNPLGLAEALYLIASHWKGKGMPGDHMAAIFIVSPHQKEIQSFEEVSENLFSMHPPIQNRIAILLKMAKAGPEDLLKAYRQHKLKHSDAPAGSESQSLPLNQGECPHCRIPLQKNFYEGIEVFSCPDCRGKLVLEENAMKILSTREEKFDSRIQDLAQTIQSQNQYLKDSASHWETSDLNLHHCPICFQEAPKMNRRFVNQQYLVEIDQCQKCTRIWFDADELDVLQYLYEKDRPTA